MAVDSRDKRMSLIGLAAPVPAVLPNPDGAFSQGDRQQLLWGYPGILWAELVDLSGQIVCELTAQVDDLFLISAQMDDLMAVGAEAEC